MSVPSSLSNYTPITVNANQIKFTPIMGISSTDVQTAIATAQTEIATNTTAIATLNTTVSGLGGAPTASTVAFTPITGISSTNVQSAIATAQTEIETNTTAIATLNTTVSGLGGGVPPATSYFGNLAIYTTASGNETTATLGVLSTSGLWGDTGSIATAYYTMNNKVCNMILSLEIAAWSGWGMSNGLDLLFTYNDPTTFPSPKDTTLANNNRIKVTGWADGGYTDGGGSYPQGRNPDVYVKFIRKATSGAIGGFKMQLPLGVFTTNLLHTGGNLNCTCSVSFLTA